MAKLIIFDLDQTLVEALPHHNRAYKKAFREIFDVEIKRKVFDKKAAPDEKKFAGKPIPEIIRELGEYKGIPKERIEPNIEKTIEKIEKLFKESIRKSKIQVLPGVRDLLSDLRDNGCFLGVVTANPEHIAQDILKKSNLQDFFEVFAYGPEGSERSELVGKAIERAEKKFSKEFKEGEIAVIGDSPHDIESGKPFGAVTVAVLGGLYSREELVEYSPDYIFDGLANPELFEVLKRK